MSRKVFNDADNYHDRSGDGDEDYYGYEAERRRRIAWEKTWRFKVLKVIKRGGFRVGVFFGLYGPTGATGATGDRGEPGVVDSASLIKLIETDTAVQSAILALHSKITTESQS